MSKKPLLTVVVPTYNREEVLVDTIHHILKQSFKDLELLVIDQTDKHNDETIHALHSITDPRFRYVRTAPPSATMAKNYALHNAHSPYVLFLDDDCIPAKDMVEAFYNTFMERPDISAVAGQVLQDGFETLPKVLEFDEYGITHGGYTALQPGYTNAFPGGNSAVVVKDALLAGGFDTRYYGNAFREENDLSLRMAKMGMKIYYQPKASMTHLAAPYGGHRIKTDVYDNPGTYANEIFFTLHCIEPRFRLAALWRKFRLYCGSMRHKQGWRRAGYFCLGLVRATLRLWFGRQRTATVITEEKPA